jgi:cold shock protein
MLLEVAVVGGTRREVNMLFGLFSRRRKMHTGKIKKLVKERGFGFISDTDGNEVFFHRSSVTDTNFDSLNEDENVEFEVEKSDKGPRAANVRPTGKAE